MLLTGAIDDAGLQLARAVLARGGRVAAALPREWQIDKLRPQLHANDGQLLIGVVADGDAEAAAGFVKGAIDVLGVITHFAGMAAIIRAPQPGKEPAGDLDEMLTANLQANAALARAVLARMRRLGAGKLLFACEPPAHVALSATCAASLAAVRAFATAVAADVESSGVQVQQLGFVGKSDVEALAKWFAALGLTI